MKGRCAGLTECNSLDFINTIRDNGVIMNKEMRQVCQQELQANETVQFTDPNEFLNYINTY